MIRWLRSLFRSRVIVVAMDVSALTTMGSDPADPVPAPVPVLEVPPVVAPVVEAPPTIESQTISAEDVGPLPAGI